MYGPCTGFAGERQLLRIGRKVNAGVCLLMCRQEDATGAGHDPLNACAELLAAADLIKG